MKPVTPRVIEVRSLVPDIPKRTYATHGIDKYPAKMVPHLARYAISRTSCPGDRVFDPFCGCGTVLVEASIAGRHSVGVDINPVAVLLARAKVSNCRFNVFRRIARTVLDDARKMTECPRLPEPTWLSYWFTPGTLLKLRKLRCQIDVRRNLPRDYVDLLRTVLVMCARPCSLADPRSPKPFISRRARQTRVGRHFDAFRVYSEAIDQLGSALEDFGARISSERPSSVAMPGDARGITRCDIGQVDAVVTSPPYLTAQDYYRSSKLELAVAGLWHSEMERTLGSVIIGSGRGSVLDSCSREKRYRQHQILNISIPDLSDRTWAVVTDYLLDMRVVLRRIHGCLRPLGKCCLIIGDSTIENIHLPVHQWLIALALDAGFHLMGHEVDLIRDRRVPPKREGHKSIIDREHLLFLEKADRKTVKS